MREIQVAKSSLTVSEFPYARILFTTHGLDDVGASEQIPMELICSKRLYNVIVTKYLPVLDNKVQKKEQKISS